MTAPARTLPTTVPLIFDCPPRRGSRLHGKLDHPGSEFDRPHLHLEGPAETPVPKHEGIKHVAVDQTQGSQVAELASPTPTNQAGRQPVSRHLNPRQGGARAAPRRAVAEHEVKPFLRPRGQGHQILRAIAAIRRAKPQPRHRRIESLGSGPTRLTVSATRFAHHLGPCCRRRGRRSIGAAVVNHPDTREPACPQVAHHRANGRHLVERGYDHLDCSQHGRVACGPCRRRLPDAATAIAALPTPPHEPAA
jgi:hypothetical protein